MGVFYEQVEVINRTHDEVIEVLYDGQRTFIQPSYNEKGELLAERRPQMLPRVTIMHALNQSVIMGSEDVRRPGKFESKLGIVDPKDRKSRPWHDISYLAEKSEELQRVSLEQMIEEYVADPTAKVVVRGKKQRSEDVDSLHRQAFDPRVGG